MVKFLVILFVAVWVLGFFFGRKRRLIRDVNHLLELIIIVVLAFMGSTLLKKEEWIYSNSLLYVLSLAAVFALSFVSARFIVRRFLIKSPGKGSGNT